NSFEELDAAFTVMATFPLHELCLRPIVDDLVEFALSWRPDLVVWDESMFAAPVAARACGAAHARLLTGIDVLGRMREDHLALLARRPPALREDVVAEWLGWNLDRFGCAFGEDVVTGDWTLSAIPHSMQSGREPLIGFRYAPYHGRRGGARTPATPAWHPRVCMTFGLSMRDALGVDGGGVGELLEAVAGVDAEIVATIPADQLAAHRRVPDNVTVVDFAPLDELLPTCAAVVHHGGAGTGNTALLCGVPQVIVPDGSWDSVHRARAQQAQGAGAGVPAGQLTPAVLRETLARVLDDPAHRENAQRLRAEMLADPTVDQLVPTLEALTAEVRAGRPSGRGGGTRRAVPTRGMPSGRVTAALGRHLMTVRSLQWMIGQQGDPYALLLRGEQSDPWCLYRRLRARGQVHRSSTGTWVVTGHAAAAAALADPRFDPRHPGQRGPQTHPVRGSVWNRPMCHVLPLEDAALDLGRAAIHRAGRLVDIALGDVPTTGPVETARLVCARVAEGLDGEFDLATGFARRSAVRLLADLLALPGERRALFAALSADLAPALDATLCPPPLHTARTVLVAARRLRDLLVDLVEQRVRRPGDDLVSLLLRAAHGEDLGVEDVLTACVALSVTGVEAAANTVCGAVVALLGGTDQWDLVRRDPARDADAVAEALRHSPPVHLESLVAQEPVELGGCEIPAGGHVVVAVGAANRDPAVWPDPHRFDLGRPRCREHLSLHAGVPGGIAAAFVELHATAAVRVLTSLHPGLRLRGGLLHRPRSALTRGHLEVPVVS
ncbi:MAG TPA: P450-derived glycosyltransferase activator, partial [Pseudonocardia sp.]|nr:P450-derived glycosyltransferase activator [Pseudonocardia sp.]